MNHRYLQLILAILFLMFLVLGSAAPESGGGLGG
jgi:hypothetical protein